jgi:hypothetical protein
MRSILKIFLAVQLLSFGLSSQENNLEAQYKQIESFLTITQNEALLREFNSRQGEVKRLLNNPEEITHQLDNAIEEFIHESLKDITDIPN